ncbi:NAD(P)/FAD-dependent oxidoreductase [Alteribacter aurantiacus]|uniref:NAD(P)/FAD-dependent oxidoreductase n=1 Tax=Alteribacter aurantiacus TaxID=254410 RepID=UPI00041758FD|nr:FAD-dependent oxidoreductase [Alteribacter aurantiacus]
MTLHTGNLFWPTTVQHKPEYPKLSGDVECDVLIIGGGESGSLMAYTLSEHRVSTILVDKATIGSGSSSANTGLLQFSNDKMLTDFSKRIGEKAAVQFYKRCLKSVDDLEVITKRLEYKTDFIRRKSLFYASDKGDAKKLRKEFDLLKKHGFPVNLLEAHEIGSLFPFEKDLAILTDLDAEVNPLKLAVSLVREAHKNGVQVFENTEVLGHEFSDGGGLFRTPKGTIRAKKVIYSTGYETAQFASIKKAALNRSYAIVTHPVKDMSFWYEKAMIWETARPYLYMRTTPDNRIIAGGLDDNHTEPESDPDRLKGKGWELLSIIQEHFPLRDLQVAHQWSATFGESKDGLPFIGRHPKYDHVYFLLGFGGNGTVYCTLGAEVIKDLILYGYSHDAPLLALDR